MLIVVTVTKTEKLMWYLSSSHRRTVNITIYFDFHFWGRNLKTPSSQTNSLDKFNLNSSTFFSARHRSNIAHTTQGARTHVFPRERETKASILLLCIKNYYTLSWTLRKASATRNGYNKLRLETYTTFTFYFHDKRKTCFQFIPKKSREQKTRQKKATKK